MSSIPVLFCQSYLSLDLSGCDDAATDILNIVFMQMKLLLYTLNFFTTLKFKPWLWCSVCYLFNKQMHMNNKLQPVFILCMVSTQRHRNHFKWQKTCSLSTRVFFFFFFFLMSPPSEYHRQKDDKHDRSGSVSFLCSDVLSLSLMPPSDPPPPVCSMFQRGEQVKSLVINNKYVYPLLSKSNSMWSDATTACMNTNSRMSLSISVTQYTHL